MGKIAGWDKTRDDIRQVWRNRINRRIVSVERGSNYRVIRSYIVLTGLENQNATVLREDIKLKANALKLAKRYMRSHPNG